MSSRRITLYERPGRDRTDIVEAIMSIARALTGTWFTSDVPEALPRDLRFHDALCLAVGEEIHAFVVFTSQDGAISISLMGTNPAYRGQGYGTALMSHLFEHALGLGFSRIEAYTVPPQSKPPYAATVAFYLGCGFVLEKEYPDLWESGAIKLMKHLA